MRMQLPIVLLTALALSGCASIRGMQEPLTAGDVDPAKMICPDDGQVKAFNLLPSGIDKRNMRDSIIADCIKAIDTNYAHFKVKLQEDAVGSNLTTDVLSLGLSGAAALTKGQTAKELAQGATVVIGVGTAINKDVFYEQTLPAVEAAMDANRATILAGILNSEKSDANGTSYTLTSAALDIDAYENAGNIYTAIAQLTKTASVSSQTANDDVAQAQMKPYVVSGVLVTNVQASLVMLNKSIKALNDPTDRPKLDAIADKIGVTRSASQTFHTELGNVIAATNRLVRTAPDPAAEMTTLQSAVAPLLQ
jgi:hypothetical protein